MAASGNCDRDHNQKPSDPRPRVLAGGPRFGVTRYPMPRRHRPNGRISVTPTRIFIVPPTDLIDDVRHDICATDATGSISDAYMADRYDLIDSVWGSMEEALELCRKDFEMNPRI